MSSAESISTHPEDPFQGQEGFGPLGDQQRYADIGQTSRADLK